LAFTPLPHCCCAQRNYQLALRTHREALTSITAVWQILQHSTVKFNVLSQAIMRMDRAIVAADKVYKWV
jgi:hypothetical protein